MALSNMYVKDHLYEGIFPVFMQHPVAWNLNPTFAEPIPKFPVG